MQNETTQAEGKDSAQTESESALRDAACSPSYPKNVRAFITKWQPVEDARRKSFWKEFRKAANAYTTSKSGARLFSYEETNIDGAWNSMAADTRYEMCRDSFSIGFRMGANSILENAKRTCADD
jgi:hypothetical protein